MGRLGETTYTFYNRDRPVSDMAVGPLSRSQAGLITCKRPKTAKNGLRIQSAPMYGLAATPSRTICSAGLSGIAHSECMYVRIRAGNAAWPSSSGTSMKSTAVRSRKCKCGLAKGQPSPPHSITNF